MLTLPLAHRLPNPRRHEVFSEDASLFDALDLLEQRGEPLCHLAGSRVPEQLAAWFERHRDVEAWRSRILHVALKGQEVSALDLCSTLLGLFSSSQGFERKEEVQSVSRLDDALVRVIDFADAHRLDVVIGGADSLDAHAREVLSTALANHVHAARWFWIWEDAAPEDVAGERVGDMSTLRSPDPEEELDAQAWHLLMVLSRQDYTIIERDALTALGLSSQTSKRLRERGLVEILPSGLALTERGAEVQARRLGAKLGPLDVTDHEALMRDFIQGLRQIDDARDAVARHFDAFKCAIAHRLVDEVDAILQEHFESFRRADLLMDVYVRLLDANEPRHRVWLFRASCYMSDFDRAESLRWREELELADAMYWVYLLLNRGRYDQLQEMASALLTQYEREGMSDEERMCCEQVRLLQARAFMQTTMPDRALETLAPVLKTEDRWMRINARFVQIRALAYAGEIGQGRELLPALLEEVESLSLAEQRKWAIFTIQTCYILKMYDASARMARRCFGDGASLNHLKSTAPILLGALWVEVGDGEQAWRAIAFARSAFRESAAMLGMLVNIDLADAIARGDVARIRGCLDEFADLQSQQLSEVSRAEHRALERLAWSLFGARFQGLTPPSLTFSHDDSAFMRCMDTLWRLRHGELDEGALTAAGASIEEHQQGDEESYLFAVLWRAWVGATRGECMVDEVERAVLVARGCAMYRLGQELAQMYCIQSYLFHPARLEKAIEKLGEMATRTGSERFLQEARWWRLVQERRTLRICDLEQLAGAFEASSLASQLLARLLGLLSEGEVGPLEELLSQKIGAQLLEERVGDLHSRAPGPPQLVLHLDEGEVWRPGTRSERVLVLDREQVGFSLLRCLAEEGQVEEVEKEVLIKRVWQDVEEYHPLRHDNRLRVAIRKLRKELREALGEEEEWIQTTSSGYAMGCGVRLVEHL